MKSGVLIFLSVVLSIHTLTNLYIYIRASQALAIEGWKVWIFRVVFVFLFLAFPLGRIVRAYHHCACERFLIQIGSWWIGAMFYLFIFILLIDLVRFVNHCAGFFPTFLTENKIVAGRICFALVSLLAIGLLTYGHLNSLNVRVRTVKMEKSNPLSGVGIKAVMFSDVHLGVIINGERLRRIVEGVNRLNPDIVFIVGDLLDEGAERLENLIQPLRSLRSKHGVYAVTGNHEYYAGLKDSLEFMSKANIKVLQNEYVTIENKFNLLTRPPSSDGGGAWGRRPHTLCCPPTKLVVEELCGKKV